MVRFLLATLLTATPVAAQAAAAQAAAAQAASPATLGCTGAFAQDTDRARLLAAFGATNVRDMEIFGPEATTPRATVLFADSPTRRLALIWREGDPKMGLLMVWMSKRSAWTTSNGLRLGLTLDRVERLNGGAFRISGFGDNGGLADFTGGRLAQSGSCRLLVRFAPGVRRTVPHETNALDDFPSRSPAIRAARPRIVEIMVLHEAAP